MIGRMRTDAFALAFALAGLVACGGGAGSSRVRGVNDADSTRKGLLGKEAQTLAPQAFAVADEALRLAKEADAKGDSLAAELHAERAIAAYNDAIALARLARATQDEGAATESLARASERGQRYAADRKAIDREAEDLEKQLRIAREAQLPGPSGLATDAERERARLVATQALVTQARLLCSAARLVSAQAPGLPEAEIAVSTLEKQLSSGARTSAPIDPAARARASCLAALSKARRAAPTDADPTDALLAALSQAGVAAKPAGATAPFDLAPARDERGVVVTLRGVWRGNGLTPEAESALKDLGRVAGAHPTFGVQVVVHDGAPPSAAETAADQKRGEAASKALADGGAAAARIKVELAGARAPVVDPQDAKRRERNARLEIVFVAPGG